MLVCPVTLLVRTPRSKKQLVLGQPIATITKPQLALPGSVEAGWTWCSRCQGLYSVTTSRGICPVRPPPKNGIPASVLSPHAETTNSRYKLYIGGASGSVLVREGSPHPFLQLTTGQPVRHHAKSV